MVLSIVVILFVGIVAYFNFAQGFFSATLSAVATVLAATLALGYGETLAGKLAGPVGPDAAQPISVCLIFIVTYVVLRLIFDRLVPGNIRMPATVDSIGAGLMGLVAGAYCVGTIAVAVQMLPLSGPMSFLGAPRYAMNGGRDVVVPHGGNSRDTDSRIGDQMKDDTFDPAKQVGLLVPVDDLVVNTVARLSDGGSLAGARPLASIHPNWLSELFAERVAIQPGTRHAVPVTAASNPVSVGGVWRTAELPSYDGLGKPLVNTPVTAQIRPEGYHSPYFDTKTGTGTVKASAGLVPLIVRIKLTTAASDDADKVFRFGLGNIRLVARPKGEQGAGIDYYPIGTLEDGQTVVINRADDFLFAPLGSGDAGIDAVFMVDPSVVLVGGSKKGSTAIADGTFLAVKRMATVDLSGTAVADGHPADGNAKVLRSDVVKAEMHPEAKPNG